MHIQREFLPEHEILLLDPILAVTVDLEVEVVDDAGENEPHFAVGETVTRRTGC
jgi:hypothetical protein